MTGASIGTALELWASSLREVTARMRGLFTQERCGAAAKPRHRLALTPPNSPARV